MCLKGSSKSPCVIADLQEILRLRVQGLGNCICVSWQSWGDLPLPTLPLKLRVWVWGLGSSVRALGLGWGFGVWGLAKYCGRSPMCNSSSIRISISVTSAWRVHRCRGLGLVVASISICIRIIWFQGLELRCARRSHWMRCLGYSS